MTMSPVTPGERIDVLDALRVYENGQLRRFCLRQEFPRKFTRTTATTAVIITNCGTHPAETTGRRSR